ncbi:MAG: peptidoglycan-binding protein [Hyphomicrobiaceae bacterium]
MSMTPKHARLAFAAFLAIGTGIVLNVLYFQDRSIASAADRAKLDKAQQRALTDRNRRLALDPKEAADKPVSRAAAKSEAKVALNAAVVQPDPPAGPRVGRFSPQPPPAAAKPQPAADVEAERSPDTVRAVHQRLATLGYEPGAPSAVPGLLMRSAIMAYEHDHGLPLTGEPSDLLLRLMDNAPGAREAAVRAGRQSRASNAEQVLRTVQQSLAALGYFSAKIDGRPGEETERSIREYEMDSGLVPTGRVSAPLLVKLARANSATRPATGTKVPPR